MSIEGMHADPVVEFDLIVLPVPSQGCLTKNIGKVCVKLNSVSFAGMMHVAAIQISVTIRVLNVAVAKFGVSILCSKGLPRNSSQV
jgi:hypothetical protein